MKFRSFILFNILILTCMAAYAQDAAPAPYTLGPGDVVTGRVHGEMGYDFAATVDEDGLLAVPFMKQMVIAQCKTERDVKAEIEAEIKKYLREPNFSLQITEKHSRSTVTVSGEINKLMEITLTRPRTLFEIISFAGGPKEEASGVIQVTRPKTPMCMAANDPDNWKSNSDDPSDLPSRTYSWSKVQNGKADSNPIIYPGDQILVKRALPVYVTGEVVAGQGVFIKENGLSLASAIAMVGGSRPEADIKTIAVYRLKPGASPYSQDRDLIPANLKLIRTGQQKDIMLQPHDLIIVERSKKPIVEKIARLALRAAESAANSIPNTITYRVLY